jgi:hypothetical protein
MRHSRTERKPLVYRFWADPRGEIRLELWETALNMQRFWNRFVALREEIAFTCETLLEDAAAIEKQFWNLLIGPLRSVSPDWYLRGVSPRWGTTVTD